MTDILNKDIVNSVDIKDLVLGTILKPVVEKVTSPIVGNGNLLSGGAKLITAFGVAKYGGNNLPAKGLAIGAALDGAEDVVIAVSGKLGMDAEDSTGEGVF